MLSKIRNIYIIVGYKIKDIIDNLKSCVMSY